MEHLKTLLTQANLSVDNLEEKVAEFGFDPQTLTEEQAELIVGELTPPPLDKPQKAGLANTSSSSNGNSKGESEKTSSLSEAIAYASRLSAEEISDLKTSVARGRSKWIASQAREIIISIRNAPKEVINLVSAELLEEEADLETFHQFANEINQAFFSVGE